MKIEIEHEGSCLGATGGTGRLIVRDALAKGHSVVALVRSKAFPAGIYDLGEGRIAAMDDAGIDVQILSHTVRVASVLPPIATEQRTWSEVGSGQKRQSVPRLPESTAVCYRYRSKVYLASITGRGSCMCAEQETSQSAECLHRRSFLKVSGAIGAMASVGITALSSVAYADALTKEQRDKLSPDDILAQMKMGNKRFYTGKRMDFNFLAQQRASAKGQYPAAVLLTCINSRAPAEMILDLRIGDVFNSRVAGNIENADILGSMEFACKLAGAKVVLVMGHTACGAIKGTIDNAELGNLTGLLAKIKPAVAATNYTGERTSKNYAFVDAVARKNVEFTVANIRKDSPVLAEMESHGAIKIAGAMYNLETGVVDFFAT